MPSLLELSKVVGQRQLNTQRSEAAIIELDEVTDRPVTDSAILRFQYFPASINDNYATTYSAQQIPGGSLPIYQWVSGGPRTISFEAIFTCDVDLLARSGEQGKFLNTRLDQLGQRNRNVDIRSALLWLRRFMLPRYTSGEAGPTAALTYAPRKLQLILPNSGIGVLAGLKDHEGHILKDSVFCHMTNCDITYQMFHPTGLPKIVKVNLAFDQVAQLQGDVKFPGATPEMDASVYPQKFFREDPLNYYGYPLVASGKNRESLATNGVGGVTGGEFNDGFINPDFNSFG